MALSVEDRRIRALRSAKATIDPRRPLGVLVEEERRRAGPERALTVFLAGAECPFTCIFCDLWRQTLDGPTLPGALPGQLGAALRQADAGRIDRVKLYNASNFFDSRAVPPGDLEELAGLLAPFSAVTVESHARTVGRRCREFADRLTGRLEVAIGLETIHPDALPRLNKQMDLGDFDRAAQFLREHGMDLRVFVLVGAPFVPEEESVRWAIRSVEHALEQGAAAVALIPARGGNGAMEQLAAEGWFAPPSVAHLEQALEGSLALGGVVTADLWDTDRLAGCPACRNARLDRIQEMNTTGQAGPSIQCPLCSR
jgi:radical SAM enzyme (TIGR01210 family)